MNKEIALLVMTDGRKDYISQTIPSAFEMLKGPVTQYYMFDDSGDPGYREWLHTNFPIFNLFYAPDRLGVGGAIHTAWEYLKDKVETDYIAHLEDDFLFNELVPLNEMIEVLETHPYLYEMSLMRQPWWQFEIDAGSIIVNEEFIQKEKWVEHRRYFTTNPCIYRKSLLDIGWPNSEGSEGLFCSKIIDSDPDAQFGIWGQKEDRPRVFHIGDIRMGTQY